jgi:ornithine cyclodeaminase
MEKKEEMIQFDTDEKKPDVDLKSQNKNLKYLIAVLFIIIIILILKILPICKLFSSKKATGILILKESDISSIITMSDIIEADKQALSIYSSKQSNIPLRSNLNIPEYKGQCLFMNGYAAPAKALGVKIVSVYPENINKNLTSVPATMVLVDAETGMVNSLLDGTYLTRLRTGAISGLATDILSRKDSKIFALFGTGGQAVTQLEAVLTVRKIEEVRVFDVFSERAVEFAKKMSDKFSKKFNNVKIYAAKTSDEAVENADIITTVTTSKKPVFNADKVKSNVHINGVGSYTPEMVEIPGEILVKANKIYVDTIDGAVNESGDLITPISKGLIKKEKINGELGEVINGKIKGRENDNEMTFFKTTGSAVLDLVAAQKIYEIAKEKGIGQIVDL